MILNHLGEYESESENEHEPTIEHDNDMTNDDEYEYNFEQKDSLLCKRVLHTNASEVIKDNQRENLFILGA